MTQAILLRRIGVDGAVDLTHRVENGLFVGEEQLAGAVVGPFHDRIEPAEIEEGRRRA